MAPAQTVQLGIELEHEQDGRWIAEVPQLPGAMTYAQSRDEAMARVQALALRVLAVELTQFGGYLTLWVQESTDAEITPTVPC